MNNSRKPTRALNPDEELYFDNPAELAGLHWAETSEKDCPYQEGSQMALQYHKAFDELEILFNQSM